MKRLFFFFSFNKASVLFRLGRFFEQESMSEIRQNRLEVLLRCLVATVLLFVWEQLANVLLEKEKEMKKMVGFG